MFISGGFSSFLPNPPQKFKVKRTFFVVVKISTLAKMLLSIKKG